MGTLVFRLLHARQYGMVIAPPIFSSLSIIAVALRFTARRLAYRKPDASDYTLLVALTLSVAYSGLNIVECIIGGGGLHVSEILAFGGSMVKFQKVGLEHLIYPDSTLQTHQIDNHTRCRSASLCKCCGQQL